MLSRALCILFLLPLTIALAADTPKLHHLQRSREILLHTGSVDTREAKEFHENEHYISHFQKRFTDETEHQYLVHFGPNLDDAMRRRVEVKLGVTFTSYLPHNTWLLVASESVARAARELEDVQWVGALLPEHKVPPSMTDPKNQVNRTALVVTLADSKKILASKTAIASRWLDALRVENVVGELDTKTHPESKLLLLNFHSEADAAKAVKFISRQPESFFIEHQQLFAPAELYTAGLLETFNVTQTPFSGGLSLQGQNEIIGIADTGIDWDNCFFYDSSTSVPFDTVNTNHRKIIYYNTAFGNSKDDFSHGTMVAGMAAGYAVNSNPTLQADATQYNGEVIGAKIAFVDLNNGSNFLNVPTDPATSLFPLTYNVGARIHAFSWNTAVQYYSGTEVAIDSYAYIQNDFVAFTAAGNTGAQGFGTVTSPGIAKNVICIGSSQSVQASFLSRTTDSLDQVAAQYYLQLCTTNDSTIYQDRTFCAYNNRATPCYDYQNIICGSSNAFKGSASDCCNFSYFSSICCPATVVAQIQANPELYSPNGLSWFSSRGPSPDGRIKPDLVAPGDRVFGAFSDNDTSTFNCERYPSARSASSIGSGTSYANAFAAGAGALVRQYLRLGYYPSGTPGSSGSVIFPNPSLSLIKAVLIASGQPLQRLNENKNSYSITAAFHNHFIQLDDIPSYYYGFGRIELDKVLKSPSSPSNTAFYIDDKSQLTNSSVGSATRQKMYCLIVADPASLLVPGVYNSTAPIITASQYLKVTLVWTDPPAAANAGLALVNNLDLILVASDGFEYRSNFGVELDAVNNVEQIYIKNPPSGIYNVIVSATRLPVAPQPFSIVVTGNVQVSSSACHVACPFRCSLHGVCNAGLCQCSTPWVGPDCSLMTCPNDCNNNGVCDGESGICKCNRFWTGYDCSVPNPSGIADVVTVVVGDSRSGLSGGVVAGIVIGCSLLMFILGVVLGAFVGIHYLIKRKRRQIAMLRAQAEAKKKAAQPLKPNDELAEGMD